MTLYVEIPVNTTATLILSQADSILDSCSLDFVRNGDFFEGTVGSGQYTIRYQLKEMQVL